jgi:hypothetical protein
MTLSPFKAAIIAGALTPFAVENVIVLGIAVLASVFSVIVSLGIQHKRHMAVLDRITESTAEVLCALDESRRNS